MKEQFRYVGYLCPKCHAAVEDKRSRFALAASGANVPCKCGGSELQMQFDGDKFRVSVPCGVCGGEHLAECEASSLLSGEGIGLACPETQQLSAFIGEEHAVIRALDRLSLVTEKEAAQGENKDAFVDTVIMYEVLSELKEIAARPHGISCECGSEKYTMEVRPMAVDLICGECGAKMRIDAATDDDLDRLCCRMTLKIKGEKR